MGDIVERKDTGVATFERKFSTNQVKLIREIVSPNLSKVGNLETKELYFQMFMNYAKRTGLDPMSKQLYALMIQDKFVIHTGIGGLRVTASRTGEYLGKSKPMFKGSVPFKYEDKEYTAPHSCEMEVYRFVKGQKAVFTAVCYWDEFYPGGRRGYKWRSSPNLMLAKCTESQCLKMGFEIELAGIELTDNIARIESEEAAQGIKFIREFIKSLPEEIVEFLNSENVSHENRIKMGKMLNFNKEEVGKLFSFLQNIEDETVLLRLKEKGFINSVMLAKEAGYDLEKLTASLAPFQEETKE